VGGCEDCNGGGGGDGEGGGGDGEGGGGDGEGGGGAMGVDKCCIGINVTDAAVADREAMAKIEVTIS